MAGTGADNLRDNLRDCATVAIINIFGLSYFSFFAVQFLLYHFPSSPEAIVNALSVIFFSGGIILSCLSSLIYCTISAFNGEDAADWQKLEFGATLVLIYTATVPSVVLQFSVQPSLQLGYLFAFTIVAVGNLVDFLVMDSDASAFRMRFPYHCGSLGFLALVPTIYALTGTFQNPLPLAVQFARFAGSNALGAALYLLRPLERTGVVNRWQPSLYVMHLVLVYSSIVYSREVLHTALGFTS